ncbi:hypothetical protein GQ44DRAFT_628924 [Phaeosphaeriaceae sp. PMI808]|nr:hypothetical protein GQ44DRAFT_628924 [Phaeosphaeriaceae sp. PMI808]
MAKQKDFKALIEVTVTTQNLLVHFQSSLSTQPTTPDVPNTLDIVKATTTLLKSHTTTLSLLLITPPLTPSALIAKISDVNSGALSGMVAAASYVPQPGQKDEVGDMLRVEVRSQVRRLLGTWGSVLALVLAMAEAREQAKGKDNGPSESEKEQVLSATGVLWDSCDVLLKLCNDGVVGLVVKKANELRSTLLDAIQELKEWGEDVDDEDEEKEDDDDGAEDSGNDDYDDIFGASNKLSKDNTELKALLDTSLKKLKMVGMLYQALIKRRLKTYPATQSSPLQTLNQLMALLKSIPDTADDLASAFYDLDQNEAKQALDKSCREAQTAAELVRLSWTGADDEFTVWSVKWLAALDAT